MKRTTLKQIRKRTFIILGVGILVGFLGLPLIGTAFDFVCKIGFLVMVSAAIHDGIFHRCPHCGEYLDMRYHHEFCRGCGKKVNESE